MVTTSIRPEQDVVCIGIVPTLEEVEKEMASSNIDVPGVRTTHQHVKMLICQAS